MTDLPDDLRDRKEICRVLRYGNTGKIVPDADDPADYVAMAEAIQRRYADAWSREHDAGVSSGITLSGHFLDLFREERDDALRKLSRQRKRRKAAEAKVDGLEAMIRSYRDCLLLTRLQLDDALKEAPDE